MGPLIAIGVIVGIAIIAGAGGGVGSAADDVEISQEGIADLKELARAANLPEEYVGFLMLVAIGESRGNNLVGLGNPAQMPPWTKTHKTWLAKDRPARSSRQRNEANAARRSYDRQRRRWLPDCWPESGYTFGSGGWFGQIPGNALAGFRGTDLECQHPFSVFDPATSVVMAIAMIKRLRGWSGFREDPTILNLRVGWGNPGSMGNASILASKRAGFVEDAQEVGLPASFLDERLPVLSDFDPVTLLIALGGEPWLPQSPSPIPTS